MATKNDITGDSLISKTNSEAYRNNYDAIFGKKGKKNEQRTGLYDGAVEQSGGINGKAYQGQPRVSDQEEDAYPHDRVPPDCNH